MEESYEAKALKLACKWIEETIGTCPYDAENFKTTMCDVNCSDQYVECWEEYFMEQVNRGEQ